MLHPKGMRRIFDKEKSNIFSNDFANGKIDTTMGLATLSLRMRKECIKTGGSKPPPYNKRSTNNFVRTPFHTPYPARYSVLHLLGVLLDGKGF